MSGTARNVLDTVRIIETREIGHDSYEICATAQARYEEASSEMQVDLDSFVRRFEIRGKDQIVRPPWLPRRDSVKSHVHLSEAPDAAKEIFESWARRVQRAIPPSGEWRRDVSWLRLADAEEPS
jgi:hypothetical protein